MVKSLTQTLKAAFLIRITRRKVNTLRRQNAKFVNVTTAGTQLALFENRHDRDISYTVLTANYTHLTRVGL